MAKAKKAAAKAPAFPIELQGSPQKLSVRGNELPPLSDEMRKKLFPTLPPLSLKQLKELKNKPKK